MGKPTRSTLKHQQMAVKDYEDLPTFIYFECVRAAFLWLMQIKNTCELINLVWIVRFHILLLEDFNNSVGDGHFVSRHGISK